MKRFLILFLCVFLVGCGKDTVPREHYDKVVKEKNDLTEEFQNLQDEYEDYKEKMKEYEGLEEAEAEARKIEAQKVIDEKNAEIEAEKQLQKEKEEAEKKAGYETGITYEQLARTPDDYVGKKVKFKGEVVQVMEGEDIVQIRFAVNSDYNSMLYCEYNKSIISQRVLENDEITILGTSYGLYSYESTLGSKITIPSVVIDKIEYSDYDAQNQEENVLLFEDENLIIYYKNLSGNNGGYNINLLIENKSKRTLIVQANDTSINGFMVNPVFSSHISPGKKCNDKIYIWGDDARQFDINEIKNIETKFHIYDDSDWSWSYDTKNIVILNDK